jgi:hypothetical protein
MLEQEGLQLAEASFRDSELARHQRMFLPVWFDS